MQPRQIAVPSNPNPPALMTQLYCAGARRKNRAGDWLVIVKAMTGTASLAVIQFEEARLVVLCKTKFVPDAGQKRTD